MKFNSKNEKLLIRIRAHPPPRNQTSYRKKLKFFTTMPFIAIYAICKTVKTEMMLALVGYRKDLKSEWTRVIT